LNQVALPETGAYRKLVGALKTRRGGVTVADITAATALPLEQVRDLLPKAADEYRGRLEVTESGEIRYSFSNGFTSRYRGVKATLSRLGEKIFSFTKAAASLVFKVWIMVMLIGYFMLFLALALASIFLSVAAQSRDSNSRRRGGVYIGPGIFNLIWRIWFYSELTRAFDSRGGRPYARQQGPYRDAQKTGRPMHRSIFSFVFGEEDPNKDRESRESKALIAYIQSRRGLIALGEFMAMTGAGRAEAEEAILAFCARYGGSPEVTEEGTIVYRFDDLLLRSDTRKFAALSPPIERLKKFSANSKNMNAVFAIINGINLIFGSYFLRHVFTTGFIATTEQLKNVSFLYGSTYALLTSVTQNPLPFIMIGLGFVPLAFSLLFWLIPALRAFFEKKENDAVKRRNLRRLGFAAIWSRPRDVTAAGIEAAADECRPRNLNAAKENVIKEMGALSIPEVEISAQGETVYQFTGLEMEKEALEKYRASIDPARSQLGATVFDSEQ
jgi:hypothetical protein